MSRKTSRHTFFTLRSCREALVFPYEILSPESCRGAEQRSDPRVARLIEETDMTRMTAAFLVIAVLAGCETVEGLGEDVEAGGEAIQRTAEDIQDEP